MCRVSRIWENLKSLEFIGNFGEFGKHLEVFLKFITSHTVFISKMPVYKMFICSTSRCLFLTAINVIVIWHLQDHGSNLLQLELFWWICQCSLLQITIDINVIQHRRLRGFVFTSDRRWRICHLWEAKSNLLQ